MSWLIYSTTKSIRDLVRHWVAVISNRKSMKMLSYSTYRSEFDTRGVFLRQNFFNAQHKLNFRGSRQLDDFNELDFSMTQPEFEREGKIGTR